MNQKYAFGVKVMFLFLFLNFQMTGQDRTLAFENDYNIRPISEINAQGYGDAYPWISNDGLRLYYTAQSINDNKSCIWSTSRSDIFSSFDNFHKLNINDNSVDNLSSWLSHDELTIAFVQRKSNGNHFTSILMADRTSIMDSFNKPTRLNIKGPIKGTLLSPSFTADLSELILFNEYKSQKFLLVFERISEDTYTFKHKINIPKKYTIKTGKLSNDGLNYYLSLEHRKTNPKIYLLTRDNVKDKFDKLVPISNITINAKSDRNHQPYFSNNGKFVVFTRSAENEWKHNEIFIGQLDIINESAVEITKESEKVDNLIDLTIYPNPSSDFVSISNPGQRNIKAFIYDTQGKLIDVVDNEKVQHYIDVSQYDAGSYIFRIQDLQSLQARSFRVLVIE